MNASAILNDEQLVTKLAAAISGNEYDEIREGDAIMVKSNTGEFAIIEEGRINARSHQGWVECVSGSTMEELGMVGETSGDCMDKAAIVAEWMRKQA